MKTDDEGIVYLRSDLKSVRNSVFLRLGVNDRQMGTRRLSVDQGNV